MEFTIHLPGADRVLVDTGEDTIVFDQDGSAPNPFTVFLASIGACAGYYVARFCRQRGIPTDGIRLRQTHVRDAAGRLVTEIVLDLELPDGFPVQYREAARRAAEACTVKRHLETPPTVVLRQPVPVHEGAR